MAGAKTSAQSFPRETGRTFSCDVLRGMDASSFQTPSIVNSWETDNSGSVCGRAANIRGLDCCSAEAMLSRMRLTLSTKNKLNLQTRSAHSVYMTFCRLCSSDCAVRHVARMSPDACCSCALLWLKILNVMANTNWHGLIPINYYMCSTYTFLYLICLFIKLTLWNN